MQYSTLKEYLLNKSCAEEDMPFGKEAVVFKVKGKMFALVSWNRNPLRINLKCDPQAALFLRDQYAAVIPGYHMNKKHWNTVVLDGSLPEGEFYRMIDRSYELVVKGLTKVQRLSLGG